MANVGGVGARRAQRAELFVGERICRAGLSICSSLFDGIAERVGVVPNSSIPCDNRNQRWRFAKQLDCRKMQRIERANWFDWKRAANASEDGIRYRNQEAAPLEATKRAHGGSFLIGRQPRRGACALNRSSGFGARQCGRHRESLNANRLQGICVTLEQSRNQSARFNVPNVGRLGARSRHSGYASPRSASISSAAVPTGRRMSGHPSVGSPGSSGGRITPAETSSSKRLGGPPVFAPGGISSATTRP